MVWVSMGVFELMTVSYDLINHPDTNRAALIRSLAADKHRFRALRQEFGKYTIILEPTTSLYRARAHNEATTVPYRLTEMLGNPAYPAQRANLPGDPITYCADTVDTALAEIRAPLGVLVTIATLQSCRPLTLINVTGHMRAEQHECASHPMAILDSWLSRPVYVLDDRTTYLTTQLFANIIRDEAYDGLLFSSSVNAGGKNYAIFAPFLLGVASTTLLPHSTAETD
jgi:hypothetical protein